MNIAWIKVSLPIELDYFKSSSNSGADDRAGFMECFINRGHFITIYTCIKPHDETLFQDSDELKQRPYMSWIKNIKYKPTAIKISHKNDVLIVEAGADTMNFKDPYTHKPFLRRFAELVNTFEGPVFYLQVDPTQPFQFKQFVAKKYPWGHEMNGYTNPIPGKTTGVKHWVMHSSWATKDEIFKNKKTILVAKTTEIESLINLFNKGEGFAGRTGYGVLRDKINFESIPMAYDPKWFTYRIFKTLPKQKLLPTKVIYSGGDRNRRKSFRRLCSGTDCGVLVTGTWKDEKFNSSLDNVHFSGWLEKRTDVADLINHSLCGIQVTTSNAEKLGWVTAKTFETVYGRSFLLMDKNIVGGEKFVIDSMLLVEDANDVSRVVKDLSQLNLQERKELHDKQIELAQKFTWEKVIIKMEELFKKYGA